MTARDPSKPPGRRCRADGGGRPEKWPVSMIRDALIEARGEVTAAARLVTAWAIAKSDKDDQRRRNKRQKNRLDEKHKSSDSPEAIEARHAACRCNPRTLLDYVSRYPELAEAREKGKRSFLVECEDVLHQAVRERRTKRVEDPSGGERVILINQPTPLAVRTAMFMLDRQHPGYRRSLRVQQEPGPVEPLDGGMLSAEERDAVRSEADDAVEP